MEKNDLYNIYEDGLDDKKCINMMIELIKYYSGRRESFPYMNEVM